MHSRHESLEHTPGHSYRVPHMTIYLPDPSRLPNPLIISLAHTAYYLRRFQSFSDEDVEAWLKSNVRRFLDGPARYFGEHNLLSNSLSGTERTNQTKMKIKRQTCILRCEHDHGQQWHCETGRESVRVQGMFMCARFDSCYLTWCVVLVKRKCLFYMSPVEMDSMSV